MVIVALDRAVVYIDQNLVDTCGCGYIAEIDIFAIPELGSHLILLT